MPPRDLSELDGAEAEAYLERYVSAAPDRLAWFERQLAETGGDAAAALDRGPESLVALWRWFVTWYDGGRALPDEPEGVPPWYEPDPPGATALSPATLWVVDGMGYHLAEVVRANVPDVRWAVSESPKRLRLEDRNKPVLVGPSGVRLSALDVAYTVVARVAFFDKAREDGHLLDIYRRWEPKLRGAEAS